MWKRVLRCVVSITIGMLVFQIIMPREGWAILLRLAIFTVCVIVADEISEQYIRKNKDKDESGTSS